MRDIVAISGVVRDYAWGSVDAIASLIGEPSSGRPLAELWFGAHPDDPSPALSHARTLDGLIDADPLRYLGPAVVQRFGSRLPFLVKLLAAAKPLSIQVHPDLAQARAGFDAEEARGVPRDAPNRNYRDRNHKPELLYALTPFEALCGFRPIEQTARLLDLLRVPALGPIADRLAGPNGLRAAFTALLQIDDPRPLVEELSARVAELLRGEEGVGWDEPLRAARRCADAFPGDVGVALSLLLNAVVLQPGEAIYLGAGNVHAYLGGLGVEVMANSDNVLRCALTPKHVDVAELLSITDFRPLEDPRWAPRGSTFGVPVPDFTLTALAIDGSDRLDQRGPLIVLCTRGSATVGDHHVVPGGAVFVGAGEDALDVTGRGDLFVTSVA